MPQHDQSRGRWAELSLVLVTFIWGSTFVVVQKALTDASPLVFVGIRFSCGAMVLAALLARRLGGGRPTPDTWRGGLFAGVFLFSGYALQTAGLRHTTATNSAFLTGLFVVMVPLLAAIVYRVWPRIPELAGVAVSTTGLSLLTLRGPSLSLNFGDLLTLGCAISFAAHLLVIGHYTARIPFERLAVLQLATVGLLGLATCAWLEQPRLNWTPRLWLAFGITAILATALALTVQAWAQRYTTATRAALIFTLEPVSAWVTAYFVSGETLPLLAAFGAAMILGGVLLAGWRAPGSKEHEIL